MRGTVLDEAHPAHQHYQRQVASWVGMAMNRQPLGHKRVFWTKYPMNLRIADSELWWGDGAKERLVPSGQPIVIEGGRTGDTGQASFVIRESISHKYDPESDTTLGLPDVEKSKLTVSCAELVQCLFANDQEGPTVFDDLSLAATARHGASRGVPPPPKNAPVDLGPDELALIEKLVPTPQPAGYGDF